MSGKNISRNKIDLEKCFDILPEESQYIQSLIEDDEGNFVSKLIKYINITINTSEDDSVYLDDIMYVISSKLILIYRMAQIKEYIDNDINYVYIESDNDSCPICKTISKMRQRPEEVLGLLDINHSFCKFNIYPMDIKSTIDFNVGDINIVNAPKFLKEKIISTIDMMYIYYPGMVSKADIIFVDDISEHEDVAKNLKEEHINLCKNKISYIKLSDKILLSNQYLYDIDYLLVKSIIDDKVLQYTDLFKDLYDNMIKDEYIGDDICIKKQTFVNYVSQTSLENFVKEHMIYYICNNDMLKDLNCNVYNFIKQNVMI